ncbi:MAG: 16S rRNA (guanine(527)-N(7))-methyltransferase RsmG [Nitrospinota bacterium]
MRPRRAPDPASLLQEGLRRLGLRADVGQLSSLLLYAAELDRWNAAHNLVGRRGEVAILRDLVLGSAEFLRARALAEAGAAFRLLDFGSGAGLPGVILKILRPHWRVDLLEARQKRAAFLKHISRKLNLEGLSALAIRGEALAQDPQHRGRYDAITARAAGPPERVAPQVLPFLAPGGALIIRRPWPAARDALREPSPLGPGWSLAESFRLKTSPRGGIWVIRLSAL